MKQFYFQLCMLYSDNKTLILKEVLLPQCICGVLLSVGEFVVIVECGLVNMAMGKFTM